VSLVNRLRGIYDIIVDPAQPPIELEDGTLTRVFERRFETPPIQHEAAARIGYLESQFERIREVLKLGEVSPEVEIESTVKRICEISAINTMQENSLRAIREALDVRTNDEALDAIRKLRSSR